MSNIQMLLELKELLQEGLASDQDERSKRMLEIVTTLIDKDDANVFKTHDEIYATIIHKLAQEYFRIFYVNIHSGSYLEYDPFNPNPSMDMDHEKEDFFMEVSREDAPELHPDDVEPFFSGLKKERIIQEIQDHGEFSLIYRVEHQGTFFFSNMKGSQIEGDHDHIIVGVKNIDADVKREKEYLMNLAQAKDEANRDGLTGIRNRHAYLEYVRDLAKQLDRGEVTEYAIVVFDVNGLKKINDTLGHQAGDRYIKDACKIICDTFKRSPVFRIGGDEFVVIAKGDDFVNMDNLLGQVELMNRRNESRGGIVIAAGMARSEGRRDIKSVFESADEKMYENKKRLKGLRTD